MSAAGTIAFACPACGRSYGDPCYHGPAGHAPQGVCLDCWLGHWDLVAARMHNGGEWRHLDTALYLISRGVSRADAARAADMPRGHLERYLRRLRAEPDLLPDWVRRRVRQTAISGGPRPWGRFGFRPKVSRSCV